jgi:hypothetical protein
MAKDSLIPNLLGIPSIKSGGNRFSSRFAQRHSGNEAEEREGARWRDRLHGTIELHADRRPGIHDVHR